jgi:hypothetical protein
MKNIRQLAEDARAKAAQQLEAEAARRATEAAQMTRSLITRILNRLTFDEPDFQIEDDDPSHFTIGDLRFHYANNSTDDRDVVSLLLPCDVAGCDGRLFYRLNTWDRSSFLASIGAVLAGEMSKPQCFACQQRKEQAAEAASLNEPTPPPRRTIEPNEEVLMNAIRQIIREEFEARRE